MTDCEWIDARERLPGKPGIYLVYVKDPFYGKKDPILGEEFQDYDCSYVETAYFDKNGYLWRTGSDADSVYNANLNCVNTDPEFTETYYISHWAEMPKGPVI